jgi:hypothetical protein
MMTTLIAAFGLGASLAMSYGAVSLVIMAMDYIVKGEK